MMPIDDIGKTLPLNDPSLLETRAFINGAWVSADKTFDVVNPATGHVIASVADTSLIQLDEAISGAYTEQKTWADWTGKERSQVLSRWYDELVSNTDDLATILCAEMGKPLAEAKAEVLYGASFIQWFAEEAKRIYGDIIPGHHRDKRIMIMKQPIGVVGSITPWNFPNAMVARKAAPALAVGCSIVARPAELTPLSALSMAVLAERAGVPAGIFNVVPSSSSAEAGQVLCSHSKVSKITFTGSTRVGKILLKQCAGTVKKLSLELGGNAPFIVFEDADINAAVEGAMIAKFRNAGQTCVCANGLYVHKSIHDAFVAKLQEKTAALTLGAGLNDDAQIGPLISEPAREKIESLIANAKSKGAKIVLGGKQSDLGGLFFEPTILTHATSQMDIAKEEVFGPVAPVFQFEDEEQLLALVNESEFGLASYFYTQNLNRMWSVAEKLECGMVGVNTGLISTEVAPFGGVKQSGFGREGSKYGCDDYLSMKYVCVGDVA